MRKVNDLAMEIGATIDHGECFYDDEMFDDFVRMLDKLKELSRKYKIECSEEE